MNAIIWITRIRISYVSTHIGYCVSERCGEQILFVIKFDEKKKLKLLLCLYSQGVDNFDGFFSTVGDCKFTGKCDQNERFDRRGGRRQERPS